MCIYKDPQGVYFGCNKVLEQCFGVIQEQIVGKTVYDISPRDLADVYRQKDEELFRHPGVQIHEGQVELPDGTRRAVVYHKATFVDAGGTLCGLMEFLGHPTGLPPGPGTGVATGAGRGHPGHGVRPR